MRVLRVENAKRKGPYTIQPPPIGLVVPNDRRHPAPWRDDGLAGAWCDLEASGRYRRYRFGFESESQLDNWFTPDELAELARFGFGVRVYEVPDEDVLPGTHQLIFKPSNAEFLGTLNQLKGIQA